jgi:hypothetical protein
MPLPNLFSLCSDYLRRYGNDANDASLTFDNDGTLSLSAGKHRIDCRIAPEFLILRARICGMPDDRTDRHAWLCRILSLTNAHALNRQEFPILTAQAALHLQRWIDMRAGYEEFCHAFDQFLEALDAWREALTPQSGRTSLTLSRLGGAPFGAADNQAGSGFNPIPLPISTR